MCNNWVGCPLFSLEYEGESVTEIFNCVGESVTRTVLRFAQDKSPRDPYSILQVSQAVGLHTPTKNSLR